MKMMRSYMELLMAILMAIFAVVPCSRGSAAAVVEVVSAVNVGFGAYMARVRVGSPPRSLYLLLDTSTSISWLQCLSCSGGGGGCYPQLDPLFDPSSSTSYSPITCSDKACAAFLDGADSPYAHRTCNNATSSSSSCSYKLRYSHNDSVSGSLALDTLHIGRSYRLRNFAFGCSSAGPARWAGVDGILALGLGPAGLPSQTAASFSGRFSFCLPTIYRLLHTDSDMYFAPQLSARGFLRLGPPPYPVQAATTTPLLRNSAQPFSYVVWLRGVAVNGLLLPIPDLDVFPPSHTMVNNTIVAAASVVTLLAPAIYDPLRNAFAEAAAGAGALRPVPPPPIASKVFDTCFEYRHGSGGDSIPTITLLLEGGLNLTLPVVNVLYPVDWVEGVACLAFVPSEVRGFSAIGAFQLQGFHVEVDTAAATLSASPLANHC